MDYQSFQPGGQDQNKVLTLPVSPKNFTPKFIGVILTVITLGGGISYGIWWWGNQNYQVAIPFVTPNPTAGWQTYMNDQYGFSLKYPPSWQV